MTRPPSASSPLSTTAPGMLAQMDDALGYPGPKAPINLLGGGSYRCAFAVSDLAQASVAAAGGALSTLVASTRGGAPAPVTVDRDLCSAWFAGSIRAHGWEMAPVWDAVAGDYPTSDGWIRLHTNAALHRAAALEVLGVAEDRAAVAAAVADWKGGALEVAVVAAGGAAAEMRSLGAWRHHAQGQAVAVEPLLHVETTGAPRARRNFRNGAGWPVGSSRRAGPDRPLSGVRVLDLTRVLAGPVATRLLAGWGAEVLRIDPPDWDEPAVAAEVTLGKRCARLDLRTPSGRDRLLDLLGSADVLVHGYRSDALEALGLGAQFRDERRPGLIDVSLDAYGWSGPWRTRRGFDSLLQMSVGIADQGRLAAGAERPVPLPVQALDHATGYLMAAAALRGLEIRTTEGVGSRWRSSLARTAGLLVDAGTTWLDADGLVALTPPQAEGPMERTSWGDAQRLPPPLRVAGLPLRWTSPARALGSDEPRWED